MICLHSDDEAGTLLDESLPSFPDGTMMVRRWLADGTADGMKTRELSESHEVS